MELEPTGERLIEEFYQSSPENYLIYLFHVVTYNFAMKYVTGKAVLDYGCGSGYGTYKVAQESKSVIGIDIARDAIEYARSHYVANNLQYMTVAPAETERLPFDDAVFDTVLSFQVIEHVRDVDSYLAEIERVLVPGGTFICATPDRSTRLIPMQKPWNVYHLVEYGIHDLRSALAAHFADTEMLQMGGDPEVLDIELRRTRKLKWLTLPVTLPFIPEPVRIRSLNILKKLNGRNNPSAPEGRRYPFGESALRISAGISPSVNLIGVAQKG